LDTIAREASIFSPEEFYLLEKTPEATRLRVQGEMRVRVERGRGSEVKYRVQVASFSTHEAAERLRARLAGEISVPVEVHENNDLGTYQVRAGKFATREEAQEFAAGSLRRAGYRDYLIVREEVAGEGGETTLALRGANNLFRVNNVGFLFFPGSAASPLRFNGRPYRGFLELSLNRNGRITLVNQLGMEEYLLGVVPAEMSPDSYPEFAALEAQSIAARTYALKNTGRFSSEGYDLTADIRSQVYVGYSGEKEAASEAVRKTAGLAIYYQDQLIDAMYSSTCGGRTEDFANVFDAPPVPYLRGVVCATESAPEGARAEIRGAHDLARPVFSDEGTVVNRALELAGVLGLNGSDPMTEAYLAGSPSSAELLSWMEQALRVAGRESGIPAPAGGELAPRAAFLRYAAESFFGAHEIERRISSADADYYLANLSDGAAVPRSSRRAIAYLMQQNLWRADPGNRVRPNEPIRRSDALLLLVRWAEAVQPQILRRGIFVASGEGATAGSSGIEVKSMNKAQRFPLSSGVRLFLLGNGTSTPADSLQMIGNEKLLFHLSKSGSIDFLEVELNPTGTSSDRYSPAATWDVAFAKSVLAEKLRPLTGNIGEFRDLKPWKLGTSGRAVQMQIIGSRRSVVLNGYKVRNAVGLKDTLFTISRSLGADGSIESFTFHGRGWGHGVGLCQVGAYGMARAGRSYEEILKTYYQGVEIRKAY
jgi:stage II sporulation protein D